MAIELNNKINQKEKAPNRDEIKPIVNSFNDVLTNLNTGYIPSLLLTTLG